MHDYRECRDYARGNDTRYVYVIIRLNAPDRLSPRNLNEGIMSQYPAGQNARVREIGPENVTSGIRNDQTSIDVRPKSQRTNEQEAVRKMAEG